MHTPKKKKALGILKDAYTEDSSNLVLNPKDTLLITPRTFASFLGVMKPTVRITEPTVLCTQRHTDTTPSHSSLHAHRKEKRN